MFEIIGDEEIKNILSLAEVHCDKKGDDRDVAIGRMIASKQASSCRLDIINAMRLIDNMECKNYDISCECISCQLYSLYRQIRDAK